MEAELLRLSGKAVENFISEAEKANAGLVYSDYYDKESRKDIPIH